MNNISKSYKNTIDQDIQNAFYIDGKKPLDEIAPDSISEMDARQMMENSIQHAMETRSTRRKRALILRYCSAAVAAVLVILTLSTPFGRALAAEAANSIVTFFSTYIFVQNKIEVKEIRPTQNLAEGKYSYTNVTAAAQALGYPLIGLKEGYDSVNVVVNVQPGMDTTISSYTFPDGKSLNVIQRVFGDEGEIGVTINKSEDSEPVVRQLFNGKGMVVSFNEDGAGGFAAWDNMSLVASSSTMTVEELVTFIDQLCNIN